MIKPKRKKRHVLMRVEKGALVPDNPLAAAELRARGYRIGDTVKVEISKARNPGFHRLMHRFTTLIADNIDAFAGMDAHRVLKRLQLEANVWCEATVLQIEGMQVIHRTPLSISFDNMDETEFRDLSRDLARHVCREYWPTCTPEEVEQMAACMPAEAA